MNNRNIKNISFYIAMLFIVLIAVSMISMNLSNSSKYTYEQFERDLQARNVKSVTILGNEEVPTGKLQIELLSGKNVSFEVSDVEKVQDLLSEEEVPFQYRLDKDSWLITTLLPCLATFGIVLLVFYMFSGQMSGGSSGGKMMNFGKSRARMMSDEGKSVKFKDVAGCDEEKEELQEIVDFLKFPQKYLGLGARIPKGVLLVGPPGTGKTLLAKAVAGEAGVPFFSISGSDFVEMFVGVGASRVRDLFEDAKKNAPCIVFIDEIDAVARRRGTGMGGGHDEREQTLNQLLVEMDGFSANEGIIVISATNRVDILDPAILRPGRFDRKVGVGRPDIKGRREILEIYARKKPLADDVDLEQTAQTTAGFTGADLENLLNEAAIYAAKAARKFITQSGGV